MECSGFREEILRSRPRLGGQGTARLVSGVVMPGSLRSRAPFRIASLSIMFLIHLKT